MSMMSQSREVALPGSIGTSLINSRVPMFLQKLYKIVDDPSTSDVICWADSGDSFFILDHERLAKEHLGHWFKHNKFPSFVRQLNMYGFHKIPHLQQGVLRSESNTEHWQFAHEHFHRGQEDRLIFIERKKQSAQRGDQQQTQRPQLPFDVATPAASSPAAVTQNPPQALDMHSIINGIAAIRRHQTTISAELNELKRSNQALWRESMEARSRHSKQQDTINRIVKFLAGVFGQHHSPRPKDDDRNMNAPAHGRPGSRLMIEDQRAESSSGKVQVTEVEDEGRGSSNNHRELSPFSTSTTSASPQEPVSPAMTDASTFPSTPHIEYPASPANSVPVKAIAQGIVSTQPRYPSSNGSDHVITPSSSPSIDAKIQAALSQLTDSDLQQFLQSLSSAPYEPYLGDSGTSPTTDNNNTLNSLTPYPSSFDFEALTPSSLPLINSPQPTHARAADGLIPFETPFKLEKTWKATDDINKEVNSVNNNISSLIETLGLDPDFLDSPSIAGAASSTTAPAPPHDQQSQELFDAFLNNFTPSEFPPGPDGTAPINMEDAAASASFLDGVPSPVDSAGSPMSMRSSPEAQRNPPPRPPPTKGRKRKDFYPPVDKGNNSNVPSSAPTTRSKRRKG